eukprot:8815227-Alexandrium_andersonii.AAC.1
MSRSPFGIAEQVQRRNLLDAHNFHDLSVKLRQWKPDILATNKEDTECLAGSLKWLGEAVFVLGGGSSSSGLKRVRGGKWQFDCAKLIQAMFIARSLRKMSALASVLRQSLRLVMPSSCIDDLLTATGVGSTGAIPSRSLLSSSNLHLDVAMMLAMRRLHFVELARGDDAPEEMTY